MKISAEEGRILLDLAKQAITSAFSKEEINIPIKLQKLLSDKRGVFVTLTKNKQLRGCIGFSEPILPLGIAIIRAAKSAAFSDPRFPPLKQDELNNIKLEITILTQPQEIKVKNKKDLLKKIKIGDDGLIIEKNHFSGLLLPQVPIEWNWNVEEFLENTCQKAGLPKEAWMEKDTKIFSFKGQLFKEK